MVKVEIADSGGVWHSHPVQAGLSSRDFPNEVKSKNAANRCSSNVIYQCHSQQSIRELAESCGASLIQAQWRGWNERKNRDVKAPLSPLAACTIIQSAWRRLKYNKEQQIHRHLLNSNLISAPSATCIQNESNGSPEKSRQEISYESRESTKCIQLKTHCRYCSSINMKRDNKDSLQTVETQTDEDWRSNTEEHAERETRMISALSGETGQDIDDSRFAMRDNQITKIEKSVSGRRLNSAPPEELLETKSEIIPSLYPDGVDQTSTRREVIQRGCKLSLDEHKKNPLILEDTEVFKLFGALNLVRGRTLERLLCPAISEGSTMKTTFRSLRKNASYLATPQESTRRNENNSNFDDTATSRKDRVNKENCLTLDDSLKDIKKSISLLWEGAIERAKKKSKNEKHGASILTIKKPFKVTADVAKTARKHLVELIRAPDEVIAFLMEHPNISKYTNDEIFELLSRIGIPRDIIHSLEAKSMEDISCMECLKKLLASSRSLNFSSLLRRRFHVVFSVVKYIVQWENAVQQERGARIEREERCGPMGCVVEKLRRGLGELRLQLDEKDEQIRRLYNEIDYMKSRETESNGVPRGGSNQTQASAREHGGGQNHLYRYDEMNVAKVPIVSNMTQHHYTERYHGAFTVNPPSPSFQNNDVSGTNPRNYQWRRPITIVHDDQEEESNFTTQSEWERPPRPRMGWGAEVQSDSTRTGGNLASSKLSRVEIRFDSNNINCNKENNKPRKLQNGRTGGKNICDKNKGRKSQYGKRASSYRGRCDDEECGTTKLFSPSSTSNVSIFGASKPNQGKFKRNHQKADMGHRVRMTDNQYDESSAAEKNNAQNIGGCLLKRREGIMMRDYEGNQKDKVDNITNDVAFEEKLRGIEQRASASAASSGERLNLLLEKLRLESAKRREEKEAEVLIASAERKRKHLLDEQERLLRQQIENISVQHK
mmetsp:Transcript_36740/g.53708  ORF Transcript_36740/g.53708 Transcript_36740/m.53708 type:complete len:946 (+) Transcript_36740:272-3109(+)